MTLKRLGSLGITPFAPSARLTAQKGMAQPTTTNVASRGKRGLPRRPRPPRKPRQSQRCWHRLADRRRLAPPPVPGAGTGPRRAPRPVSQQAPRLARRLRADRLPGRSSLRPGWTRCAASRRRPFAAAHPEQSFGQHEVEDEGQVDNEGHHPEHGDLVGQIPDLVWEEK